MLIGSKVSYLKSALYVPEALRENCIVKPLHITCLDLIMSVCMHALCSNWIRRIKCSLVKSLSFFDIKAFPDTATMNLMMIMTVDFGVSRSI